VRDMNTLRARMEQLGDKLAAREDTIDLMTRSRIEAQAAAEAQAAEAQRTLLAIRAQMAEAQEAANRVDGLLSTQLLLTVVTAFLYCFGGWFLGLLHALARWLFCCRRKRAATRHVYAKSTPNLTAAQRKQLKEESAAIAAAAMRDADHLPSSHAGTPRGGSFRSTPMGASRTLQEVSSARVTEASPSTRRSSLKGGRQMVRAASAAQLQFSAEYSQAARASLSPAAAAASVSHHAHSASSPSHSVWPSSSRRHSYGAFPASVSFEDLRGGEAPYAECNEAYFFERYQAERMAREEEAAGRLHPPEPEHSPPRKKGDDTAAPLGDYTESRHEQSRSGSLNRRRFSKQDSPVAEKQFA